MVLYFVFLLFTYRSMADNFILLIPIERIAGKYYVLKKITSKIQKTASSIGFLNQSLYHNFILTLAKTNIKLNVK